MQKTTWHFISANIASSCWNCVKFKALLSFRFPQTGFLLLLFYFISIRRQISESSWIRIAKWYQISWERCKFRVSIDFIYKRVVFHRYQHWWRARVEISTTIETSSPFFLCRTREIRRLSLKKKSNTFMKNKNLIFHLMIQEIPNVNRQIT